MTPDDVASAILEAQALNAAQARLGYNPSDECDSILEHAKALYRTATPGQRPHLVAIARLVKQLLAHNADERELEREVAGVVDLLGACEPRDPLTIRGIADRTRGPLALLMNPIVGEPKHAEALAMVIEVLDAAQPARVGTREHPNASLSHELGPRKYGHLLDIVAERQGAAAA